MPALQRRTNQLARATLLQALQTERSNMEELESSVMTLQRNNLAIVDVVSSPDSLISELNNRVAVFEENKMVLKAALRQLQMEMREDTPKTEALLGDLAEARLMEGKLSEELERLVEEHGEEREEWEDTILEIAEGHNTTKSKLDLIGLYVDQLEDCLVKFAIARKELEVRKEECLCLKANRQEVTDSDNEYKCQVENLVKE